MNKNNKINSLKLVMAFALLLCAFVSGMGIEIAVVGLKNIIYWTIKDRGLWLLLWTAIAYGFMILFSKDIFFNAKKGCSK